MTRALKHFESEAQAAGAADLERLDVIPRKVEPALVALDTAVKNEITPAELRKHSGYYEDVAKLMGGKIAVARIKATINLANARTEAKAAKAQLDAETERMCEMIASGETPYLAPTKKPKAKEGEVESAGRSECGRRTPSCAAAQFQFSVTWKAPMKQQLLKVDLCVMRWVKRKTSDARL